MEYTKSNHYEWPDLKIKIKIKTRAVPHGSMEPCPKSNHFKSP